MSFISKPAGNLINCTAYGIPENLINNPTSLIRFCEEALLHDKFTILDKAQHAFSPQGFTAVFVLAESHLAIHTYPEFGSLVITLYSCRGPRDGNRVIDHILSSLGNPARLLHEQSVVVDNAHRQSSAE